MRRKKKKSRVTLKKRKAVRPRHPRVCLVCHRNDRHDKERKSLTVCPKYITVVKNEVFQLTIRHQRLGEHELACGDQG